MAHVDTKAALTRQPCDDRSPPAPAETDCTASQRLQTRWTWGSSVVAW